MKKMIVIAALIGGMLMPAQMMAQKNMKNEKPRIENRDNRRDKKDMNFGKPAKNNRPGFAMNKPAKPAPPKYRKPMPPKYRKPVPPVVINRPAPRPCPPPPPAVVYRNYYENEVVEAVEATVAVIGLAALIALAAN